MPAQQKCHSKVISGLVLGCYSDIMSSFVCLVVKMFFLRAWQK